MKRPEQITIAGAGLAGALLAVLLGQRGYQVRLLESRPDMRRSKISAGRSINLALSSRGIHALGLAGLLDQVNELLIPMHGRLLHLPDGSTQYLPYGQKAEEVIYSVSRRDLNSLMMTAAEVAPPVNVYFRQKVEEIDFQQKTLAVRDLDSNQLRSESYELLIGADGAGSAVRQALIPFVQGTESSEPLDHDYKELEIPATANQDYQIEKEVLHIWPRGEYMLIALPNQGGSFTVTLFLPKSGQPSFASLTDRERVLEFFQDQFPDALELIPRLADDFFDNPQGRLGTLRCQPWYYRDEVLLIGDAAHAVVPFHGQGMNASFEDCSELIRLLDQHHEDWETVLPIFNQIRSPNANAIADMALENYITMRASVAEFDFQLKKEVGFELERRFPDRFIPRYSLVMFHRVPYAITLELGRIQEQILSDLVRGKHKLNEIDFALAEKWVKERLPENVLQLHDP